jgi:hypothetical protein
MGNQWEISNAPASSASVTLKLPANKFNVEAVQKQMTTSANDLPYRYLEYIF